jgi:dihydropteroate synthase
VLRDQHTQSPGSPEPEEGSRQALDDRLSQRFIALDPAGYFLIRVDRSAGELVAEHFGNSIDDRGLATDPETGEVLSCRGGDPRLPKAVFRGRTAKEVGIRLTEEADPPPLSRLDHALYLGRELQKAERCLLEGTPYVQD